MSAATCSLQATATARRNYPRPLGRRHRQRSAIIPPRATAPAQPHFPAPSRIGRPDQRDQRHYRSSQRHHQFLLLRRGRHHPGGRPDRRHLRPYRARSRKKPTRGRTRSTPRDRWISPWIHVIDPPVSVYSIHSSHGWPGRHGDHGGGNPQRELDLAPNRRHQAPNRRHPLNRGG